MARKKAREEGTAALIARAVRANVGAAVSVKARGNRITATPTAPRSLIDTALIAGALSTLEREVRYGNSHYARDVAPYAARHGLTIPLMADKATWNEFAAWCVLRVLTGMPLDGLRDAVKPAEKTAEPTPDEARDPDRILRAAGIPLMDNCNPGVYAQVFVASPIKLHWSNPDGTPARWTGETATLLQRACALLRGAGYNVENPVPARNKPDYAAIGKLLREAGVPVYGRRGTTAGVFSDGGPEPLRFWFMGEDKHEKEHLIKAREVLEAAGYTVDWCVPRASTVQASADLPVERASDPVWAIGDRIQHRTSKRTGEITECERAAPLHLHADYSIAYDDGGHRWVTTDDLNTEYERITTEDRAEAPQDLDDCQAGSRGLSFEEALKRFAGIGAQSVTDLGLSALWSKGAPKLSPLAGAVLYELRTSGPLGLLWNGEIVPRLRKAGYEPRADLLAPFRVAVELDRTTTLCAEFVTGDVRLALVDHPTEKAGA